MIEAIRELPPNAQRDLINLLDPSVRLDQLADADLLPTLVKVLRKALEVPSEREDLGEYLRKRLVDVVRRQFELTTNVDMLTDMEIARLLVDFVLYAAREVSGDESRRHEFETFLRTKSKRERVEWLVASRQFAALAAHEPFDADAAQRAAEELHAQKRAHEKTAQAILVDLGSLTKKTRRPGGSVAALTAVSKVSTPGAGATAVGAVAQAVARPLGALAGGLFMAGRGKRELLEVAEQEASKTRAQRARRSKLVQAVVALSAFVVAHQPEPGS